MPGLVGFAGTPPDNGADILLRDMLAALEPGSGYQVEAYHTPTAGLGRVSLGIVNPGPQPVWNADHTVCLYLEGEVYDYHEDAAELQSKGYRFNLNDQAAYLLHRYLEHGPAFAEGLNSSFVVSIWDEASQKLVLATDRLGTYPLYYAVVNQRLLFASGVRALLADPALPRETDRTGIAQFLTFDHLLNDRTLLKSVKLLRQASVLTYSDGELDIRPYWQVQYPEHYELRPETEWMEQFVYLVEQAIRRQSEHTAPLGILLSGGIDSRMILPSLKKHARQPLHAFTWGNLQCDDLQYASEVARLVGVDHHFFELKPGWLLDKAEEAVRLTDGMGNLANLHALATLDQETQYSRIIFKGFLGDAMMGFGQRHQHWATYDSATALKAHLSVHRDQGVISFEPDEHHLLFTENFHREVGGAVLDEYIAGMYDSGASLLADQRLYFDYYQRVPRMTIKGVEVVRSKAMVRLPFCDNDLIDFSIQLTPGLRYERRLMKNAFVRAFPELAQIPITETGLPLMLCAREIRIRAGRMLRWHLHQRGLLKGPYREKRPYANYGLWFRTILRNWVEDLLLSPRAVERGYYNPEYLRKTITAHMNGADYAVHIGAMLSIELWHRMYLD
jgi:asparagine synthase (glutamine-hydrolysing)